MVKTSKFKNLKLFIEWIKTKNSVNEIIDEFETQSEKGFVFERLFDLVIKFGYCNIFCPNNNFKHIISNVNNGIVDYLTNLQDYLTDNKVSSGNSGGASDITLYDTNINQYIFISSKYPKSNDDITKSKSVDYYDIQNIIAMATKNNHIYENYKIYLVVPNKKKVLDKVKKANKSSKYITEHMTEENILDEEDLNKYFLELKKDLLKYNFEDYDDIFMKKKEKLKTRFHQKLINQKTSELIDDGEKQFLWGLKCRSGKTYCCADLIKYYGEKNLINVLIITPAPTETTPQFEEVFNDFMGFENFDIHSIKSGKDLLNIEINKEKSNIFIASKQLLQNYTGENTIEKIKNLKLKFIFSDENHHASTTNLAKQIFESYSSKKTVKIYLTATYNKPLKEWGIPENCQMYWDIEDEQICKAICKSIEKKNDSFSSEQICKSIYNDEKEIIKLVDKHGELVNEVIEEYKKDGYSIKDIFKSYLSMPDLYLLSSLFDSDRYDIIKEKISDSEYGFSFETLLSLNSNKTKLKFENEVGLFLRYISGSNKEEDFKKKDKSIFSRINNICSEKESRLPFTQIWFLPPNNINEISKALIKVIEKDSILSQYDFYPINSKNNELEASKIKQIINNFELKAKKENKKGLILLAGNMLSLGITLSNCDVVMLFNNTISADKVMQQMYRCMTEGLGLTPKPSTITEKDKSFSYMTEGKDKKFGFVVDLNISRVLNTSINYSIYKKDLNIEEKLKYMFDYHLINMDVDMWENKKLDSNYLINKLLSIWKNDPINNLKIMLKNLDNEYLEFDNDTQKLLNKSFTSSIDDKLISTIEFKDDNDESQSLKSGKETIKIDELNDKKELNDLEKDLLEEEKKEKEISFTKDVLPYVIPLVCILTMSDANKDFVKMLSDIKENPELLEIFDDQSLIWWNKKNLIDIIKNIVEKFINKNSNTFNISINFKMGLKSLIDKPKELLELINECLKPKNVEKKKFGEVFTPMTLVFLMLDLLPPEIWENKNLKILDPCVGMGNFMIGVYFKLMEGLKKIIVNEKERKRHILENMLYMCEINKKNCYIFKQIFDINNEYKLNLHNGDYLNFDSFKIFKLNNFDLVVGNPPYNPDVSETNAKGQVIWPHFTTKSFELLSKFGYLLFIHPPNWRKPKHELHKMMFDNLQSIKILSEKDSEKYFKCKIRVDYYLLQKNNKKKNTKIIDENNIEYNMCIKNMPYIANYGLTIHEKIINSNVERIECINPRSHDTTRKFVKKTEDDEHIYKLLNTSSSKGLTYYYSSKIHPVQNKKKVMFSNGRYIYPFYDDGKLGGTQSVLYIETDNQKSGVNLLNFINSNIFKFIIKSTKFNNFAISHELISTIPNYSKTIKNIDDKKLALELNLTTEELLYLSLKNNDNDENNSDDDTKKNNKSTKIKKNKSIVNK
jgi:hypothetical protein